MRVFWTNPKDLSNSRAETNLVFVKLECNFVKVSMKPYFGAELENKKLKKTSHILTHTVMKMRLIMGRIMCLILFHQKGLA